MIIARTLALIIVASVSLNISFCSSSQSKGNLGNSNIPVGWIDENTYWINAEGRPTSSVKNVQQRRLSAKQAAIHNAHFKLYDKFQIYKIKEITQIKRIKKIIENGTVLKKNEMYSNNDSCAIIYEVKSKNLKNEIKQVTN